MIDSTLIKRLRDLLGQLKACADKLFKMSSYNNFEYGKKYEVESQNDCDMNSDCKHMSINPHLLEPEICLVKKECKGEDEDDPDGEPKCPDNLYPIAHVKVEKCEVDTTQDNNISLEVENNMMDPITFVKVEEKEDEPNLMEVEQNMLDPMAFVNIGEKKFASKQHDNVSLEVENNMMDPITFVKVEEKEDEPNLMEVEQNMLDPMAFLNIDEKKFASKQNCSMDGDSSEAELSVSSEDELGDFLAPFTKQEVMTQNEKQSHHNNAWNVSYKFSPLPAVPYKKVEVGCFKKLKPLEAFNRYIPEKIISDMAVATSQRVAAKTGIHDTVTTYIMKTFIAINIIMSYIRYPRIRMYWASKTCVPQIADAMKREHFFLIRNNLACRDYDSVTEEEKKRDIYWKIKPILECVRNACLANPRDQNISIYLQKIKLASQTRAKKYDFKPTTEELKNFIAITSDGLPLDFCLYQSKEVAHIDPKLNLDLGGKVVVKLAESLPPGCHVNMSQYFTSLALMEVLSAKGIHSTGTLQKQRIPHDCNLYFENGLKRQERRSFIQLVRKDGKFSIVKCHEKEEIIFVSDVHGVLPTNTSLTTTDLSKYCKRPDVVLKYNLNMLGVDLFERLIAQYRISAENQLSKNWIVKTLFHFIDFAIVSAWIERRRAFKCRVAGDRVELIDFKVEIAYGLLMHSGADNEVDENIDALTGTVTPNKRKIVPLPNDAVRSAGLHLPERPPHVKMSKCRLPGCKYSSCRFWCKKCKIFLCLTGTRNCFKTFHEQ